MEKIIVLDVEGSSSVRPYNVGYLITDRKGSVYKSNSICLSECFFENLNNCMGCEEMTHKNIERMLIEIAKDNGDFTNLSIENFWNEFESDIKYYDISKMYAYNISFDKSALTRLFGDKFTDLNLEYRDILTGIFYSKLFNKKYVQFCIDNNFLTPKGNVMTKAEVVYKYLTNNLNFIEEHTGLDDVKIENEILQIAFNSHKKLQWQKIQAWRLLKDLM